MSTADETLGALPDLPDLALSRSTVRREGLRRSDPGTVRRALGESRTRVLTLRGAAAPVADSPRPHLLLRAPRAEDEQAVCLFLGDQEGVSYLAVLEPEGTEVGWPQGARWCGLREVGAELDETDAGLLTTATALSQWHARHTHCPRCGARTTVEDGGWVRRCPEDASEHHPRTDPAVIMAVTDEKDRLLLATGVAWPEGRFSVLAGFVEAGESLEAAVAREVHEEVGIDVTDVVYRGNQPWPFPASLMLAYRARATGTELVVDPGELRSAAWFGREELAGAVREGSVRLPSRVSIARRLIEEWFGGPLSEAPEPDPSGLPRTTARSGTSAQSAQSAHSGTSQESGSTPRDSR